MYKRCYKKNLFWYLIFTNNISKYISPITISAVCETSPHTFSSCFLFILSNERDRHNANTKPDNTHKYEVYTYISCVRINFYAILVITDVFFGLVMTFIEHSQNETKNKYNAFTVPYT
jgi:hypothetical protein